MMEEQELNGYIKFDSRLTRAEVTLEDLTKAIADIKKDIRWLLRTYITFSTAIIGILLKSLPLIG
jgi:hypothetical protein